MVYFFISLFYLLLLNLKPDFFKKGVISWILIFFSSTLFFMYFFLDEVGSLRGAMLCPLFFMVNYKISRWIFLKVVKREPRKSLEVVLVFDADDYSKKFKDALFYIYNNVVDFMLLAIVTKHLS